MSEQREWDLHEVGTPSDFFWYALEEFPQVITCDKKLAQTTFANPPVVCVETLFFTNPAKGTVFPFAPIDRELETYDKFVQFLSSGWPRHVPDKDVQGVIQNLAATIVDTKFPTSLSFHECRTQARAYVGNSSSRLAELIYDLKRYCDGKVRDIRCLRQPANGIGKGFTRGTDGKIRDTFGNEYNAAIGGSFEIRDGKGKLISTHDAPVNFEGPMMIDAHYDAGQSMHLPVVPISHYTNMVDNSHSPKALSWNGPPPQFFQKHGIPPTIPPVSQKPPVEPPKNPKRKFRK